jgi:hypothetical protein
LGERWLESKEAPNTCQSRKVRETIRKSQNIRRKPSNAGKPMPKIS